ncbi:MAG: hypothetical protein H8E27_03330 [Verrucomicrobia subdivision 3 bacterium]|nr:hypothetical protein [Limisphaerales bacterium]
MQLPGQARGLLAEYYRLRALPKDLRTTEQVQRLQSLGHWHRGVYSPNHERWLQAKEAGDKALMSVYEDVIGMGSKAYGK